MHGTNVKITFLPLLLLITCFGFSEKPSPGNYKYVNEGKYHLLK